MSSSSSSAFSSSRKESHHRQMALSPMDWNQRGIQMMMDPSMFHWKAALDCFRRALLVVGSNSSSGSGVRSNNTRTEDQILMDVIAAEAKAAEACCYPFHSTPFPLVWVSASTSNSKAALLQDQEEESAAAFCLQSAILITNTAIVYHRQAAASQPCYAQKAVALYTKAWQLLHRMPTNSTAPALVQYLILTIGSNVLHLVMMASSSSERWSPLDRETTMPLIQEFAWHCQHVQPNEDAPPRIAQAIEAKRAVGCLAFFWLSCRQAPHAGAA